MGLRQQLQYCHPTKMPIQDTPKNGERAMLCIEFQVSQRSRHHIHQRCPKRKKHQHHDRLEVHRNALLQPLLEKQNNRTLKQRLPIEMK
jgi:hypothetical protein